MDTSEADHWHCLGSSGPNFDPYRRELGSGRVAMPAEERPGENTLLGPLIFLKKRKKYSNSEGSKHNVFVYECCVVLGLDFKPAEPKTRTRKP